MNRTTNAEQDCVYESRIIATPNSSVQYIPLSMREEISLRIMKMLINKGQIVNVAEDAVRLTDDLMAALGKTKPIVKKEDNPQVPIDIAFAIPKWIDDNPPGDDVKEWATRLALRFFDMGAKEVKNNLPKWRKSEHSGISSQRYTIGVDFNGEAKTLYDCIAGEELPLDKIKNLPNESV